MTIVGYNQANIVNILSNSSSDWRITGHCINLSNITIVLIHCLINSNIVHLGLLTEELTDVSLYYIW